MSKFLDFEQKRKDAVKLKKFLKLAFYFWRLRAFDGETNIEVKNHVQNFWILSKSAKTRKT